MGNTSTNTKANAITYRELVELYELNDWWEALTKNIKPKRLSHITGVMETAYELALRFDADPQKAVTAALFHDWYRGFDIKELDRLVDYYEIDPRYKGNPNLAHSKLAAELMSETFDICDEDTLNAVRYHTTGRVNMSLLEKVVYLADCIEPSRDYEALSKVREYAAYDLNLAMETALLNSINHVREEGIELDKDTLEAYYSCVLADII